MPPPAFTTGILDFIFRILGSVLLHLFDGVGPLTRRSYPVFTPILEKFVALFVSEQPKQTRRRRTLRKIFLILFAFLFLALGIALIVWAINKGGLARGILLAIGVSILPTIVDSLTKVEFLRALFLSTLETGIVALFSIWVIGNSSLGLCLLLLFVLVFMILVGSVVLRHRQNKIINRLKNASDFSLSQQKVKELGDTARHHIFNYYAIPLGIIGTTLFGMATGTSEVKIYRAYIPVVVILVSFSLLITMVIAISKLSSHFPPTDLDKELNVKKPMGKGEEKKFESRLTEIVEIAGELRTIYFLDSIYATSLLIGFAIALIGYFFIQYFVPQNLPWALLISLVMLAVFCFIPYAYGQNELVENILDKRNFRGEKRDKLKTALVKVSPLYPKSDIIQAISGSGAIIAILITILWEMLKNILPGVK